jgi:kelch-like protein 10
VYAIGGHGGFNRRIPEERYDYKTNQWSLIASINKKRFNASAAALNGNMNPVKQYRVI